MWSEALSHHGKYVLLMSVISFGTMFQLGYVTAYPNTAFTEFKAFIYDSYERRGVTLTENHFNWIWSVVLNLWYPGCIVGTWATPFVAERFGRKVGLVVGNAIDVIATGVNVVGLLTHLPELVTVGRLLTGVGDGLAANCLTLFLQESAPTQIRGLVSGFQELSVTLSILIGMLFGLQYVLGESLWILTAVAAVPNCIAIAVMFFCPDTPKFLYLGKKSTIRATEALRFFHGTTHDVEECLQTISQESANEGKTSFREVWNSRSLRKAMLLGSVAFGLQLMTGTVPITLFSTELFRRAGFNSQGAEMGSIIMAMLNCLATALSLNFVDRCGRRLLLLVFGSLNVLSIAAYALFAELSEVTTWANFGLGPVPWYLTAELVPQKQRSYIQSIAFSANTVAGLFTGLLTLPLYGYFDAYSFIPLFIIPSIICLIYLFRQLPETKNKEIYEIVKELEAR
uniref:Major facilitator superfamily (MFS) profile domain-containing protein n=1 Tax=Plectus sambesii TaxID=2011161 RepID=A0A914XCL8_9BILA